MEAKVIILLFTLVWSLDRVAPQPGFLSLDCGANSSYTDPATGIHWQPDQAFLTTGGSRSVVQQVPSTSNETKLPSRTLRSFAGGSNAKFCYTLPVNASQRYLVRATFFYGNYDGRNTAPEFHLFFNLTLWAEVLVEDSNFEELIFLSTGPQVEVCLVQGRTGVPFISTLELRQLFASMYSVPYETRAHLKHSSRVNYGALTTSDIRYPDDPVDRIWQSDLIRPNNLAREAPGTLRVSTNSSIRLDIANERPPERVMQTAVVGSNGNLTYRYLINDFPANAFGKTYFAEIQNLRATDVRAFTFLLPNDTLFRNQVLNLQSDVGAFRAYEPGFDNVTLTREIINFAFQQAPEANVGPILNAMEILKIVRKQDPTSSDDVSALQEFVAQFQLSGSADPCKPVVLEWITCSSDSSPRITGLSLPGRGLNGSIPSGISRMTSLLEIDLSNNSLSGPIPDMNRLSSLRELHLQNNRLSGNFPQSLAGLGSLQELYVQNNFLTGSIPSELLSKQGLDFEFSGNPGLCTSGCSDSGGSSSRNIKALVGGLIGGVALCLAGVALIYFFWYKKRKPAIKPVKTNASNQDSFASMISTYNSQASDSGSIIVDDQVHRFTYQELRDASNNFSNKVGSGGFGTVYYGRLKTGIEIAIKVLSPDSHQGVREFTNEVTLLSRIHHRDLVQFLGFCLEGKERILVYEFMRFGNFRDCLYGTEKGQERLNWIARIKIVLDAARGVDYLHTGCNPSIIHRDIKSSNILISDKRAGKVSDFGLSKLTSGETSLISTTVKGTVGYLDPEYYMNQRLTEKSDVYSFGIVLLETISAREPLNAELFEPESNIVQWARVALQKGNIKSIVDPALGDDYRLESMWKVAETAIFCVEPYGVNRPTMNEVVRGLQEALELEDESSRAAGASDGNGDEEDDDCSPAAAAPAPAYHLDAPRNPMALVFAEPDAR